MTGNLATKKVKAWKNRTLLKETIMTDGYKIGFWLYEWNNDIASKLGHDCCLRIRKLKPDGHVLMTEQIGIRVDNWPDFVQTINSLNVAGHQPNIKIEDG